MPGHNSVRAFVLPRAPARATKAELIDKYKKSKRLNFKKGMDCT
jgi:hypothetical protein